jgi:hypothetical protein
MVSDTTQFKQCKSQYVVRLELCVRCVRLRAQWVHTSNQGEETLSMCMIQRVYTHSALLLMRSSSCSLTRTHEGTETCNTEAISFNSKCKALWHALFVRADACREAITLTQ